jgi:hypothetical protein
VEDLEEDVVAADSVVVAHHTAVVEAVVTAEVATHHEEEVTVEATVAAQEEVLDTAHTRVTRRLLRPARLFTPVDFGQLSHVAVRFEGAEKGKIGVATKVRISYIFSSGFSCINRGICTMRNGITVWFG